MKKQRTAHDQHRPNLVGKQQNNLGFKMICTNELRWIERSVPAPGYGQDVNKIVQVLQQKWIDCESDVGEWRDIPVVKE